MTVDTTGSLRITRVIHADRQSVWDAWTQPEMMKRWMCPAPNGVQSVESDLKVGGAYAVHMVVEGNHHNAFGVYKEIDEPRRISYTWDWREEAMRMGETLVTVEFNEVDGGTEVVLTHEGFPAAEAKTGHEEGWNACLNNLEAALG